MNVELFLFFPLVSLSIFLLTLFLSENNFYSKCPNRIIFSIVAVRLKIKLLLILESDQLSRMSIVYFV